MGIEEVKSSDGNKNSCKASSCIGGTCKEEGNGFVCICDPGLERSPTNPNLCADVNECEVNSKICGGANELCLNFVGSYECMCAAGYQRNADSQCVDVNECEELNPGRRHDCGEYEECVNTPGSYECAILDGEYDD